MRAYGFLVVLSVLGWAGAPAQGIPVFSGGFSCGSAMPLPLNDGQATSGTIPPQGWRFWTFDTGSPGSRGIFTSFGLPMEASFENPCFGIIECRTGGLLTQYQCPTIGSGFIVVRNLSDFSASYSLTVSPMDD
jgi:hypothetical protein